MASNEKEALASVIDGMRDDIVGTLQELVRIPSVTGNEAAAQKFMHSIYESAGIDAIRLEADHAKLKEHPAYCDSGKPLEGRPNIIGILNGDTGKKSMVLNGHVDVVSPEPVDAWKHDPWGGAVDGNRLYGRGACDMKAGLIANLYAVKALMTCGMGPMGKLTLQSTIEEEDGGGGGTLACLMAGYVADAMIVPEPSPYVNVALAGIRRFKISLKGQPAHPAESQLGVNAIGKMLLIYRAIEKLDAHRKETVRFPLFETTGNPAAHLIAGTINGGDHISTVAGFAEMGCRAGFIPGETQESIKNLIESTVKEVADQDDWLREHPPEIEWLAFQCDPYYQDPEHPFVTSVLDSVGEVIGEKAAPKPVGNTWSEDTRFAQYFDFPAVSFGPKGKRAHGVDEYVDLDSVILATKSIAYATFKWCTQDK